jgi:hypothetical protein
MAGVMQLKGIEANYRMQAIYKSQDVVQVNIPAESGDMGVLANHVPSIEQLKPGLVEVIEESGGAKQFFRTRTFSSTPILEEYTRLTR